MRNELHTEITEDIIGWLEVNLNKSIAFTRLLNTTPNTVSYIDGVEFDFKTAISSIMDTYRFAFIQYEDEVLDIFDRLKKSNDFIEFISILAELSFVLLQLEQGPHRNILRMAIDLGESRGELGILLMAAIKQIVLYEPNVDYSGYDIGISKKSGNYSVSVNYGYPNNMRSIEVTIDGEEFVVTKK